jgi:hypothetical protein
VLSSFLLASALIFQQALRPAAGLAANRVENKTRDASDRLLPPERFTCTRTSCVPSSLRDFHRVDTPRSLGLRAVDWGTGCFTTPENASADRRWTRAAILPLCFGAPFPVRELRAWAFYSHGASIPIEPLTPLSPLPLARDHRSAFATPFKALALASSIAFPREEAAKVAVTTFS